MITFIDLQTYISTQNSLSSRISFSVSSSPVKDIGQNGYRLIPSSGMEMEEILIK